MKDRDIAVVVSNANKDVSAIETIDAIKNAGFTNVFIQWYNRDWKPTQEEQLEYIRKKGLNIILTDKVIYFILNSLFKSFKNCALSITVC